MKKYVVVDRNRNWDSFDFICEDTTNLGDIWHSHCPYNLEESQREKLRPLIFEKRSDAVKYKDAQQSSANHDWSENGHIHKIYGHSKPRWKVEEYNGDLFS